MRILIEGSDYVVRVIDFPDATIGGAVIAGDDDFYNVYINARRSWESQAVSLMHELRHIAEDDFYNGKPISEIEP